MATRTTAALHEGVGGATDADRWLLWAAGFFAVAVFFHNSDHLRRGSDAVSADVFWIGNLAIVVEVVLVVLVVQRHRLAPLAALAGGAGLAAGYVVVHFLPQRSWLSDSFTSGSDVSPLSWWAASLELASALALALTAWALIARRGGLARAVAPTQPPVRSGPHPIALAFLTSQAVTVAISFLQL